MQELGIERLCVFDMPPVEFVQLAAELGCAAIGTALTPMGHYNPHGYPDWSLRDDPALRREMRAAMREGGVRISLLEGFAVTPDNEMRDYAGDLDMLAELGGQRINLVSIDKDRARTFDAFATMTELAGQRGIEVTTEVGTMGHLDFGLDAIEYIGSPNFRLLLDTMHYFRLGGTIERLAQLDPQLIGYVQLCDVPLVSPFASYREEALYERMAPGAGELPLAEFVALLRPDVVVSLEIPQRSLVEAGVGPRERVGACVAAARELLASG